MPTISESCLRKLPIGKFCKFDTVCDMDGKPHIAVVWVFIDPEQRDIRYSSFDVKTGEYLGEDIGEFLKGRNIK